MKIRTLTVAALIAATTFGVVGCSGGGGGGGGTGSTAAGSTGQVSSGLPTPSRDAAGYSFASFYQPAVNIQGATVSAMQVAAVGTQTGVLIADSPFSNVAAAASGTAASFEVKLNFDASSMATIGTSTYAATANRDAPGAGDLYRRNNATGTWTLIEDSGDNEMVVAAVSSSDLYTVRGSIESAMKIKWNGTEVAAVNSARPTSAAGFRGKLVVGATFAGASGGAASLYQLNGSTTEEIQIPVNGIGGGVFQEVTGMTVAQITSGATVTGEFLFVSVGEFDITGQALSGSVMVTNDGKVFESIANYNGDAPTSIAWVDSTIFVGTAGGALQYRDDTGVMVDEPGLPVLQGIRSLTVNGTDLYIGATTSIGAEVFVRLPGSGSTGGGTVTPVNQDYFYNTDIAPIFAAKCASCHNGGLPAAEAAWPLTAPTNALADHTEVQSRVDLANPTDSVLIAKAVNDNPHVGGEVIKKTDPEYQVLVDWITQGALFDNSTNTPPPPAPKSFASDVFPLLQAAQNGCVGCHAGGTGGYTASNNVTASFNSAISKTNQTPGQEEMSLLLRKAAQAGGTTHGGGTVWPVGSVQYNLVLDWIKDGVQQ